VGGYLLRGEGGGLLLLECVGEGGSFLVLEEGFRGFVFGGDVGPTVVACGLSGAAGHWERVVSSGLWVRQGGERDLLGGWWEAFCGFDTDRDGQARSGN